MSRQSRQRLLDVIAALDAIEEHLRRGGLDDELVFDAVRIRLVEIGEAVKALPGELLDQEPAIPWSQVTRMRERIAHRYFDTTHGIVAGTIEHDLPLLRGAVDRLLATSGEDESHG